MTAATSPEIANAEVDLDLMDKWASAFPHNTMGQAVLTVTAELRQRRAAAQSTSVKSDYPKGTE